MVKVWRFIQCSFLRHIVRADHWQFVTCGSWSTKFGYIYCTRCGKEFGWVRRSLWDYFGEVSEDAE